MNENDAVKIVAGALAGTVGEFVRVESENEDGSPATVVVRYAVDPRDEHHAGRLIELPADEVDELLDGGKGE